MNWRHLRHAPWLDTRARFVARAPRQGALLDVGSSDGKTLRHMAELRPDLRFFATDIAGKPETYPAGCQFHRGDLQLDKLPWPDASIDAITCMHLIEHVPDLTLLMKEVKRLLRPGREIYFETPHPRSLVLSSPRGDQVGRFTLNFYDDPTHLTPVSVGALAQMVRGVGLEVINSGISRNWPFVASHLLFKFMPPSHYKYTAQGHWLGWSAYLIARRPL